MNVQLIKTQWNWKQRIWRRQNRFLFTSNTFFILIFYLRFLTQHYYKVDEIMNSKDNAPSTKLYISHNNEITINANQHWPWLAILGCYNLDFLSFESDSLQEYFESLINKIYILLQFETMNIWSMQLGTRTLPLTLWFRN